MADLRQDRGWRSAVDVPFAALCVATALALVRSIDQPGFTLDVGGSSVSFVPTDVALAFLAALCVQRLLGSRSLPRPAVAPAVGAAAFSGWMLLSSLLNGGDAIVAAAKLLEYGILALGVVLFVRRRIQLWLLTGVLGAFTVAAVGYGLLAFFDVPGTNALYPGGRQPSFLGEHDLAALATMVLAVGLAGVFAPSPWLRRLRAGAIAVGSIGVVLGAALAGLLALYLTVGGITAIAVARGAATTRRLLTTGGVTLAITIGALALRTGEIGAFLRSFGIGEQRADPYGNAASWNERLIDAYIGGRIFLDNPVVGTGWHGQLPPEEYVHYLDDARARFPDQPANYFPSREGFIPQQTYDQILYELGIVGAFLFLALALVVLRAATRVARAWPLGGPEEALAYLPLAWVLALAGGLAGAALFGGIPLAAMFWTTIGVAALAPSLVPPGPPPELTS